MVFNLTHSQIILRYKENGGRIEPYTIVIMKSIATLKTALAHLEVPQTVKISTLSSNLRASPESERPSVDSNRLEPGASTKSRPPS
jgi:hypothetical protein